MRRLLCVLLVGGCFNPGGSGGSTGGAGTTVAGVTTSTEPATPTSVETTTTGDPPITLPSGTTTEAATSEVSSSTTTEPDPSCPMGCGPCESCVNGECVVKGSEETCTPAEDACAGIVSGEDGNGCYDSVVLGGSCQLGTCVAKCGQGSKFVSCVNDACRRGVNPCVAGANVADVTVDNYCEHTGVAVTGCNQLLCVQVNLLQRQCVDEGTCLPVVIQECPPYTCDVVNTQCYEMCEGNVGCAPNAVCDMDLLTCE
jgi:hypothetical protein